jgi:hypothetical protein
MQILAGWRFIFKTVILPVEDQEISFFTGAMYI